MMIYNIVTVKVELKVVETNVRKMYPRIFHLFSRKYGARKAALLLKEIRDNKMSLIPTAKYILGVLGKRN